MRTSATAAGHRGNDDTVEVARLPRHREGGHAERDGIRVALDDDVSSLRGDLLRPGGLAPLCGRTDQTQILFAGMQRR